MRLDVMPANWEEKLVLFVSYLVEQNRKSSTIKSYISGIKALLREDGIELSEDTYLITSLTKACKLQNECVRVRFPIHKELLLELLDQIDEIYDTQPYLRSLYQSLFSTAYYGMFRVGALTTGSHPVLTKDVHIAENKPKILFVLHTSKTHGKDSKPQMIKISVTRIDKHKSSFNWKCPFHLLKKYLALRSSVISY